MSSGRKTRLDDGSEPQGESGRGQPTRLETEPEHEKLHAHTRPQSEHAVPRPPMRVGRSTRLEVPAEELRPAHRQTRLEGAPQPPAPRPPGPSPTGPPPGLESPPPSRAGAASRATRLESATTRVDPRQTILQSSYPAELQPSGDDARALVAVLAAPGLGSGGAVFPIRAGKNTIGADPASDVCLRADGEVSGEHALLLCRRSGFFLADRMSTNGTWVNGEEVDVTAAVPLADRDVVRVGNTRLLFLVVELDDSAAPAEA